ncbi:MAG: amino acid adenylation domain-containing protein [Acidimicrobiia bacterium]
MLLHHLVAAAAAEDPDAVAVVDGAVVLTYGELDARSDAVARVLVAEGIRPGERIGLYLEKSADALVHLYGVLKAGGVYVPLDAGAPTARLGLVVADSGMRCIVASARTLAGLDELLSLSGIFVEVVLVVDAEPSTRDGDTPVRMLGPSALVEAGPAPVGVRRIPDDLAYILYTSGSTGTPKGVMLTHRNALAFVDWAASAADLRPEDRLSSVAPLHFDLSIFDVFAAAWAGARVVLVPTSTLRFPVEIRRFIERHEITVWYSVPSILNLLTMRGGLAPGSLPSLRVVYFAGEVFPTRFLRQLMHQLPATTFWNLYGPTETNVCTAYRVPNLADDLVDPIPIGWAIRDDETFVVTEDGRLASPGEVGVLHVRGATVMAGYWNSPERTAEVLRPSPFHHPLPDPAYRTGDLVRELPDGSYEFLGRADHQIKTRGYRIELGDVESALYAHPAVEEAAVIAQPDEVVTNRLVAFVALNDEATAAALLDHCRTLLPAYMVPERLDVLTTLPRTSTGKVDRQRLAAAHDRSPERIAT